MATNFPASLDTLTNPTSSDSLSSPSHSAQHANVNDAVEALQAKVGADSSAVTSSLDYKVAQLEALGTATAFTPSWSGLTIGNGTDNWFYIRVNDLILVTGQTTLGSTSAITGGIQFTCPSGTLTGSDFVQMGTIKYGVSGNHIGSAQRNGNNFSLILHGASSTYVSQLGISATVPGTWGSGNTIRGTIVAMVS